MKKILLAVIVFATVTLQAAVSDFSFNDCDGNSRKLSDFTSQGKYVFWMFSEIQ